MVFIYPKFNKCKQLFTCRMISKKKFSTFKMQRNHSILTTFVTVYIFIWFFQNFSCVSVLLLAQISISISILLIVTPHDLMSSPCCWYFILLPFGDSDHVWLRGVLWFLFRNWSICGFSFHLFTKTIIFTLFKMVLLL